MTRASHRPLARHGRHAALLGALLAVGVSALPAHADTISGDQGTANRTLTGSGTTWDLSNATFTQSGYNGGDLPIRITGSNLTVNGGKVTGDYPSSLTWWDLKDPNSQYYANGAAYQVDPGAAGKLTLNNGWGKNIAVDMFRTQAPDLASATFNRPYSETVRDDIFSLSRRDDGTTSYKINDALVEGYTGISWRNTGPGAGKPFNLTVNGMVMHLKPQALSSGSCDKWAGGDGNKLGNGSPFKMDSYKGTPSRFLVKDTVIWLEEGNRDACTHDGPDATFQNVTVVWTGPGSFPGTIPTGMKLTTNKSVYDAARSAWFNRAGNAPAPAPTTSPSPVATTSPTPKASPSPSATSSPA